jgi:ribonuclease HI
LNKEKIIIYTDGGSRGNPGPAALGVVIKDTKGQTIKSYGEALGKTTNNEAEYEAVVFALKKMKALMGKKKTKNLIVEVFMDSELIVNQLNGKYKIEEDRLIIPFIKIWNLKMDFNFVSFHHVPREQNREADRMVNEALDREQGELFLR